MALAQSPEVLRMAQSVPAVQQALQQFQAVMGRGASLGSVNAGSIGALGGVAGSLLSAVGSASGDRNLALAGSLVGAAAQVAPAAYNALTGSAATMSNPMALVGTAIQLAHALGPKGTRDPASEEGDTRSMSAQTSLMGGPISAGVAGITDMLMNQFSDKPNAESQEAANKTKGALYSSATENLARANELAARGGSGNLYDDIVQMANQIAPYYATAQGRDRPYRASDTLTGGHGATANQPFTGGMSIDQYQGSFQSAKTALVDMVKRALAQGASYEDLGSLPVTLDWTKSSLDAGNRPDYFVFESPRAGQYQAEANALFGPGGGNPIAQGEPTGGEAGNWVSTWTKNIPEQTQELLDFSLGDTKSYPDATSPWVAQMYGGPLWTALARMGAWDLMPLITEHFDPWGQFRENPEMAFTPKYLPKKWIGTSGEISGYGAEANPLWDNPAWNQMPGWMQRAQELQQARMNAPQGSGTGGAAGEAIAAGKVLPPNVITGTKALPRPEADARSELAFGLRRPLQSQQGQDQNAAPPPPTPGTSAAEASPFATGGGGFSVTPGGQIGTGGLFVQAPFGQGRPGGGMQPRGGVRGATV